MAPCVICGVDDSTGARDAVSVAAGLGEKLGLRLVVVHVAQPSPPAPSPGAPAGVPPARDGELAEAARLVERLLDDHRLAEQAEPRVQVGDPVERLAATAESEDAAVLVVGSRGRGALASALLGSVSAGLPARAPCPVVIVPPRRG
jgi:nucleotide-binding universal stress UspA family protein